MASYACVEMEESKERDFVLVDLSVRLFEPHVIPPYSPSRRSVRRGEVYGEDAGCGKHLLGGLKLVTAPEVSAASSAQQSVAGKYPKCVYFDVRYPSALCRALRLTGEERISTYDT